MKISKQKVFKFRTFLENLVKFCQYFFERITRIYLINHNRTFSAISIIRHGLYQFDITVFFPATPIPYTVSSTTSFPIKKYISYSPHSLTKQASFFLNTKLYLPDMLCHLSMTKQTLI